MAADTFWRSSPRAVHLLYRHACEVRNKEHAGGRPKVPVPARGRERERTPGRRVRLNYLPHP